MMAVSFERYGRLYYLDPGDCSPPIGDKVLVPTGSGPEVAECVWARSGCPRTSTGCPSVRARPATTTSPGASRTASAGPEAAWSPSA